ncbi:polysaccharide deacetylase family protein [Clostridium sp.]|uniref:polysaccharide deacetylase family protein n=1 Tax=Clostridium sp. TaxID=1506 RepID=UPI001A643D8F|nr:polysaccharide deacetylase family protein [Clostridium sp.]MBK5234464.1 polysaccharide deacetylase [Clostridium sp.]
MRISQRNKRQNKRALRFLLVKIFTFTLCISLLVRTAVSETTVVASENESDSLKQQIVQIHTDNKNLKSQNNNLRSTIKQNNDIFKENLDNTKIAYLTFDDGPSNNTLQILKILKQYNIQATFFVNGHPNLRPLYKAISDAGNVLGNHTYSHQYKNIYISPDNFKKDVEKLDALLTDITGKEPSHILRYPGGSNNEIGNDYGGIGIMNNVIKEMNNEGYLYFDWNVDSSDASTFRQDKDKIVQAVLTQSSQKKHAIILLHDLNPKTTTVQALPEIIEGLKNQGFIFDVLSKNIYAPQFKIVK